MKEDYLMTGPLEPTNEGYALAKIAGLKLAEYYHRQFGMSCLNPIPCNLYGTNDSFDPDDSHVLSALVRKFVDAAEDGKEEVVLWGRAAHDVNSCTSMTARAHSCFWLKATNHRSRLMSVGVRIFQYVSWPS